MANYAVIDVGSNSIRLVVYSVPNDNQKAYRRSDFSSLANDKVMAGLAAYVSEGIFTPAGIKKATSTIKSHLKHASYFKCKRIDVFATAVLRNAQNSAEAIKAIEKGAGCKINLISGEDEALLGFAGASSETLIKNGVTVDIGGGSTELALINDGKPQIFRSVPQGSLCSYTGYVKNILPTEEEMLTIRESFEDKMRTVLNPDDYRAQTLYGIGGSVRAAAKMMAVESEDRVRPKIILPTDVDALLKKCVEDPSAYARQAIAAAPERIHTLTPGCTILSEVMHRLGASSLRVCKCGIREGYLITRMLEAEVADPEA